MSRCFTLLWLLWVGQVQAYGFKLDPDKRCPAVQNRLGQLLYINVDGFGKAVEGAIHPDYIRLVKLLNIGGVVPQFKQQDFYSLRKATGQLFKTNDLPLLIGARFFKLTELRAFGSQSHVIGLTPGLCQGQLDLIDAFLFKAVGFNQWFGPKLNGPIKPLQRQALSQYRALGLFNTARYPWQSVDQSQPFLLTHHGFDPEHDRHNILTLSRQWLKSISDDVDFNGLLLSDAAVNATHQGKTLADFSTEWLTRHPQDDPKAVFVARALLAGHNMVYLKGTARDTLTVYQHLSQMACREDSDGTRLQHAIEESFHKVSQFKRNNRGALTYRPKVNDKLVQDALDFKYRLTANQCAIDDRIGYNRLREQILMLR